MLKIDGVGIPTPSDFQVGIQDISKAERNARGSMIIERIATKRKLEIGWRYLTDQQLKQLLNAVSPVFFQVDYPDPQTGGQRQGTFYAGDRTVGAMDYIDSKIRWKEIKFNVIER